LYYLQIYPFTKALSRVYFHNPAASSDTGLAYSEIEKDEKNSLKYAEKYNYGTRGNQNDIYKGFYRAN